jgi:hypothetical protein
MASARREAAPGRQAVVTLRAKFFFVILNEVKNLSSIEQIKVKFFGARRASE